MSASNRHITLRFLAQPTDVNFGGNVHGGSAMKWLDQAGYVCATAWSNRYCVTAFVGDINFIHPIRVGDLVTTKSKVIHTGRTSMHIAVEMYANTPTEKQKVQAIRCIMVFVAVDEQGNPVPVPAWQPENEEDERSQQYALRIMELRKINKDEMLKHTV
ncbi:MAG: acyl-CoA thioesterase [Pseudomonadales bacterium]|nr:acyl-CoA thioesterase [Pseudomonadales bacterium]